MKPWRDLDAVPMPARIARLPRDQRGYPIPVNVLNSKGVLDFRATDPAKMARIIEQRCCALCGEPLGARMAFVGGPKSMASRYFTDAPCTATVRSTHCKSALSWPRPPSGIARAFPRG